MYTSVKPSKTLLTIVLSLASITSVNADEITSTDDIERISVTHQKQPYRGDVSLKQMPQSISIVEGDFLNDAGIVSLQGALDFSSGVVRQNNFGGMWDGFAIRGFSGDENLPSGYLINGFSAGRGYSGRRNTSNIESIEVLKGPGSALYGRSEPGGTVNIITKKPQFFEEGYIQVSAASYENYQLEGDYTNVVNDDLAFRINGAYQDSESFRDNVESKSVTFSPSVLYKLSDSTSVSYELELLDQDTTFDRGIVVTDGNFGEIPINRFYGEPSDGPITIQATGHQLVLQHEMNNGWDFLAGLGYRNSSFIGYSTEAELSTGRQLLYVDNETLSRQRRYRDYEAEDLSVRFEFSGNIETGSLVHHLLIGLDAYDYELDTHQSRWRTDWGSGDTTYSVNLYDPVYGQEAPEVTPNIDRVEQQNSIGAYVQNQIDLTADWKLLLGLRVDKFDQTIIDNLSSGNNTNQEQTATSPRVGLVYDVSSMVSLYGSYSEGFRPNSGADFEGNAFDPEESKSFEVGMKFNTKNDDISGTLAFYNAEKSNILTANQAEGGSIALGEAESTGVELDIAANITENTKLTLAYAYTDAHTLNDMVNPDWGVEILAGSQLINIAKNTGNLTLRHYFNFANKEADIGASVNYVGERLGETIDPTYILPAYTTTRLFGSVELNESLRLMFDIDNLFDEVYYASSYSALWTMPGSPRTFRISAKYQF